VYLHNQIPSANRQNFVNHDELRAEIRACVLQDGADGPKVVALGGSAGVGKTALALVTADELRADYPDGHLFARLDADPEAAGLVGEILKESLIALGVPEQDIPDRTEARSAYFRSWTTGRRVLFVIDGATTAAQVRSLLPGAGASLVIVTEARPLHTLSAAVPTRFFSMEPLTDDAARELLVRLTRADRIAAEPDEVDKIIALCCGLPVALCVVGSMLSRPPERPIARTLRKLEKQESRLSVLSRADDLSVSSVFTAAYELLSNSGKSCYRALGLPPSTGEIALDAMVAALDAPSEDDVRDWMDELLGARLVEEPVADRYLVSELVRLHASTVGRVDEPIQRERATGRLVDHYFRRTADAESLAPQRPWRAALLPPIPDTHAHGDSKDAAWRWLEQERGNIRAAIEYAYSVKDWQRVQQWCVLLWQFYESGKYADDLLATHQLGVDSALRLGNAAVQSLLSTQTGFGHNFRGDPSAAIGAFDEAARIAANVGDRQLEATAVEGLGLALREHGDEPGAREKLRYNLKLARKIKDDRRIALACLHGAKVEAPKEALALLAEADTLFAARKEPVNQAKIALWRGIKLTELGGRSPAARAALDIALQVMNVQGRPFDRFQILAAFGDLNAKDGDPVAARGNYREALAGYETWGFTAAAEQLRHRLAELGPEPTP